MPPAEVIELTGESLTLDEVRAAALGGAAARLSEAARERLRAGRAALERRLAAGETIYGVNTGFGDLANVRIPAADVATLQERLVLSHAAGVGAPLADSVVRAMLLLRANALARGHSGVREVVVDTILGLLAQNILPIVPRIGSVGASGDLAPLAHLALALLGHGTVRTPAVTPAKDALSRAGLVPLRLEAKEGLALINGTQAMTALLALAAIEARRLAKIADLVGALSTDAMRGADTAFDERLHATRPHAGQRRSAANLWRLLARSSIRASHRDDDVRVQDPYSLRCMPQVHGAARDVLADVEAKLAIEMNASTDNPLVLFEADENGGAILSGGNFHGQPMAFAADFLAIALAELGSISERRIEKLTNAAFSGLPPFLVREAGLNSGFMMAHVTAAALLAENRVLAHPASIDSVSTSADKEDHVSMGMTAANKLEAVVLNTRRILGIELLAAAQGLDLLRPLRSSAALEALHADFRRVVPAWSEDRWLAPDLDAAERYLAAAVEPHLADLE